MPIDLTDYTEAWKCNEASGALIGVNGYNWNQSGPLLGSTTGKIEDPVGSILGRGDFQPIGGTSNEIYLYDSSAGIGDIWDVRGATSCTFAGWVKLYPSMDTGYWCASLYETSAANKQAFRFAPYSSDGAARNPIFRMFDGLSSFNELTVRATTGVAIPKDEWQFVAYGYNADTNKIFCFWGRDVGEHYYNTEDGFAAGFGYSVTTGAHHSRFIDGGGQGTNQKNDADQLMWWNGRALTEDELVFLWNNHSGRALDDLIEINVPPDDMTATAVGPIQVRLNWTPIPAEEDGYDIQRARGSTGTFEELISGLPAGTSTHFDEELLADEAEFCYRIRAIVEGVPSDWSDPVCVTTLAIPEVPPVTPDPSTLVQPNTFGGLIIGRTGAGLDADKTRIEGLGFTIIATDPRAGETKLWVHGPGSSVDIFINDFDIKTELPGKFFPLPVGEVLTASLIRSWTERVNLFFN